MSGRIRFFRQHTMETCGASCALMLLDYYGKVQYPTKKQEMKLYTLYRSRVFKGITPAALADCLSKNDLQVELRHSSPAFLDNRDGYFEDALFRPFLEEYLLCLDRCKDRVQVHTGAETDTSLLQEALAAGCQVLAETFIPGDADGIHDHALHWVLIYGWDAERFQVCDPLSGKITLTAEELEGYMDTPLGRISIIVKGHP